MKKILMLISAVIVLSLNVAFASVPRNYFELQRGISRMCYYVDESADDYVSLINTGIKRWTQSGYTPTGAITMIPVSSTSATDVDIYVEPEHYFSSSTLLGKTYYYTQSGVQFPEYAPYPASSYYYTEVYLNEDALERSGNNEWIGTMAHEMGHVFGLADNNSEVDHIMCQTGYGRTTSYVHLEEYAMVISLYD